MQVGIAGAGAIALGYAAFLELAGHDAIIWSPSGKRTQPFLAGMPLEVSGAINGEFHPSVCADAAELAVNSIIIIAMPANGHRAVLDQLAPHLGERHIVIISSHLSFAALHLSGRLAARGLQVPIVAWATTMLTSKAHSSTRIKVGSIRTEIDMATEPFEFSEAALELCNELFGDRFTVKDDLLTIALSNLNPQSHMAIALCNLTRMERGESWGQRSNITPSVGRLMEGLDRERLAIAAAFGKPVRTIFDHYAKSFGVTASTVHGIAEKLVEQGKDPAGPRSLDTRYVFEDVPFGLYQNVLLARSAGISVPLHQSGIDIFGACYGVNFRAGNDLMTNPAASGLISEMINFELARQTP